MTTAARKRVLLRNSERTSFKTCRFRWALGFGAFEVGPLRSREPAKALWFGDLIHRALAAYYRPGTKRGPKPRTTFLRLYDADNRLAAVHRNDEGEWESLRDLGAGMLVAYVERYAAADAEWEVISSERTFKLPIPDTNLVVVGTFDGLWRHRVDRERVAFKEFKTASTIALDGLAMDDQASFYWTYGPRWLWGAGLLPKKRYPSEILYTFLRKSIRNPDFSWDAEGRRLNKDGSVSKAQPAPYFERQPIYRDAADRELTHAYVMAEAAEIAEAREGKLTVYKNPGPLHNPNCRGCPFRDPCELHQAGADWESMLRATTEPWDPYEAHELIERR